MSLSTKIVAIVIFFTALILRAYNYYDFSITADEVSAIQRAQFSNFSSLIQLGVLTDTHPPFVQVFLFYWIKLGGISEARVRLPFVLLGFSSIYFFYRAAKNLTGEVSALISTAILATTEFTILYSRLARPYAAGLFFSALAFWMITELKEGQAKKKYFVTLSIALAGCFYSHYFSALQGVLLAILGLGIIYKNNLKHYLASCFAGVLLCLPAYKILISQLNMKGLGGSEGGWLAPPDLYFVIKYFLYCFNNSYLLMATVVSIAIVLFALNKNNTKLFNINKIVRIRIALIILFIAPLAIGYFYSVARSPILQKSILLFSFPYLFFFIFSFHIDKKYLVVALLLLTLNGFITCYSNKFYSTSRFGEFKAIALNFAKNDLTYGEKNISKAINVVGPYSMHYNFGRIGYKPKLVSYLNNGKEELMKYCKIIDTCSSNYFSFAWTTRYSPYEITEIIQDKYPNMFQRMFYYNSSFYLFGNTNKALDTINDIQYQSLLVPGTENTGWNGSKNFITDSITGKYYFELNEQIEYSPTFEAEIKNIVKSANDIIHFKVDVLLADSTADADIVIDFSSEGKNYNWQSNKVRWFKLNHSNKLRAYISATLPSGIKTTDKLKAYVWNSSKKHIFIEKMILSIKEGNPLLYGEREDELK